MGVFGADEVTSGASSDLAQATNLAQQMVTTWGMSDTVGPVFYNKDRAISGASRNEIDKEVDKLLKDSYERATNLLKTHRSKLDNIAKGLIEYETLSGEEVKLIMKGKKIRDGKKCQGLGIHGLVQTISMSAVGGVDIRNPS